MRHLLIWPLLLSSIGLSNCTAPTAESTPATPVHDDAVARIAIGGTPGPNSAYQPVQAENIVSADTGYAATLPVLNDSDGSIRVRGMINPLAHKAKKITVLFAPHHLTVTYKQVGEGVCNYEPTTDHYYFKVLYQKIRKLPAGLTNYGSLEEIGGWVKPGAATAAVAHKAAM